MLNKTIFLVLLAGTRTVFAGPGEYVCPIPDSLASSSFQEGVDDSMDNIKLVYRDELIEELLYCTMKVAVAFPTRKNIKAVLQLQQATVKGAEEIATNWGSSSKGFCLGKPLKCQLLSEDPFLKLSIDKPLSQKIFLKTTTGKKAVLAGEAKFNPETKRIDIDIPHLTLFGYGKDFISADVSGLVLEGGEFGIPPRFIGGEAWIERGAIVDVVLTKISSIEVGHLASDNIEEGEM